MPKEEENRIKITKLSGIYSFLSNFYHCQISYDGTIYPSVEHAYQAAKTIDPAERNLILDCATPAAAKRMGRTLTLRTGWEESKLKVMKELVRDKFRKHPLLRVALLETKDAIIAEGNWWGDKYWGTVNGEGENHLGRILMEVREELQKGIWG